MAFDILGFRDKYKGFYGDAPLEDVAKDAFVRGGYDQEHPDFDTWKQSAGIGSVLEEDRKRRNPTFEDKLRSQVEQKQEPTVMGELAKGAKSGWLGANKAVGQVLQFAGKEIGIKPLEDIGQTTSEYWGNKMEPQTAAVQDIRDINSWHDFGKWAAWNIGQTGSQLATMAPFMFMGGGEIKMAKGGFTVLGDLLKGNPGAATQFGKFIGQWAKLKPVDIPIGILEGGQVLGGQLDALEKGEIDELHPIRGLASAFVATKLEELGDVLAVEKMVHGIGGQSGKLIARIAKGAVGTGLGEATEEFFQQYAEQFGIDPTNITSKEQFMQAINGAAAGFVGGGAMGSFTGALNKSKEEGETPKNQEFNVQSKALLMNVIDLGLKSGQNPEHPFAVEDTINLIKKSQDSGILAPDDIDNLKNRYPQLRDALNGVIAENITKKVDEVVTNTLTNTIQNLSDVKLLPGGQGFELKGEPYQEGVTVGDPYGDVLRPVKRKAEDNVIDAEFSTVRRIEAPKREETKLLPGQGFELSETDQDEISTLQERIQKVQTFLDKNEKHKGGVKYQQVLDRLDADKARLAELTKGGEDNGTLRETETTIEEKPGETPDATQQQPGDIYSGKAFRVHTTNLGMDAKSALDKINFEANELGNKEEMDAAIKAAEKHGVDLSKTHPDDIVWVTRDKDTATKLYGYGEEIAEEQDIPEGSVVLSDIGEDGVLVLKGNAVKGNELPAPLSQTDAATVGVTKDEAKSGESLNNQALIEEARKYKTVDEFVQKTHGRFVANADKLTPAEKELADAFYKSDKEAIWNKAQETKAPETGQAKEPWQMTREEVRQTPPLYGDSTAWRKLSKSLVTGEPLSNVHKSIVKQALSEGKPVPPEVLKDYPELRKAPAKVNMADRRQEKKAEAAKNKREAAIEKYRNHVLEKNPKSGNEFADKIVKLIDDRDGVELRKWMNGINPRINKLFYDLTGLPARTQKEVDASLRSLDSEKWDAEQKSVSDAQEKRKIEREEKAVNAEIDKKVKHEGQVLTKRELYDKLIGDGFTRILEGKRGVVPIYELNNPNSGMSIKIDKKIEAEYLRKRIEEKKQATANKEPEKVNPVEQEKKIESTYKTFKEYSKALGYEYPDSVDKAQSPLAEFNRVNEKKLKENGINAKQLVQKFRQDKGVIEEKSADKVALAQKNLDDASQEAIRAREKYNNFNKFSKNPATQLKYSEEKSKLEEAVKEADKKQEEARGVLYQTKIKERDKNLPTHEEPVTEQEEPEAKVIPVTPKDEKNVVTPREQKKYLLEKIDEALKEAPEGDLKMAHHYWKYATAKDISKWFEEDKKVYESNKDKFGTVTIEVPNDGTFTILNVKSSLEQFKKQTSKFPASVIKGAPDVRQSRPSLAPIGKRIEQEGVSYYNDFKPRKEGLIQNIGADSQGKVINNFYVDGYFTDGRYIIKTNKPTKIELSDRKPDIKKLMPKDKDLVLAKIVAEYHYGSADGTREAAKGHIIAEDGTELAFNAHYLDSVLTEHPTAKVYIQKKDVGMFPAIFKEGKEVVGIVMPLAEQELPTREGFLQEFNEPSEPTKNADMFGEGAEEAKAPEAKKEEPIKEWQDIPELDAQIRTIEKPTKDFDKWTVQIGVQESLGERGGDIITEFYKEKPTLQEIKEDIIEHYKYKKIKINDEVAAGIVAKSGRDEAIEEKIDNVLENKKPVKSQDDINKEIVASLQEASDKITDIYKVPKIAIQITTAKGKGAASYNTWRVKGGKINNAKDITIYNYDEIKNSKGEIIHKLSHELSHHINNSLHGSLKHDNRQGDLEDDIGSYMSAKMRDVIKTEKEIIEGKVEATADSGEELKYNKRNRIKAGIKWEDIKDKNTALKVKETNKQNVYPKPDYTQMVDDGMEPMIAHIVKQIYDSIPIAPTTSGTLTDEAMQRYITAVNRVMDGAIQWANDKGAIAAWAGKQARYAGAALGKVTNITDLAQTNKSLVDIVYPDGYKAYIEEIRILGGNKVLKALQPGYNQGKKAMKEIGAGWPGKLESWQKQGFRIIERKEIKIPTNYTDSNDNPIFIGEIEGRTFGERYKTKEEAQAAIDKMKPFILVDKYRRPIGQFDTVEEAQEAAREKVKRENKPTINEKGISVQAAKRTGEQRREPGENITTDKLRETFGFKGVNFGNWMKGNTNEAERQLHLNHAYDSFMDLAEILNVPPKAMSLNGLLGVAIGAQGSGAHAAHFVPGLNEINLTRTAGAGAMAHEWGHALDHYFANQAGLESGKVPYLTEHAALSATRTVMEKQDDGTWKNVTRNTFSENIRPEIVELFKKIVHAMNKKTINITPEEQAEQIAARKEDSRKRIDSWLRTIKEDFIRNKVAAEDFDRLADRIKKLDLGEGKVAVSGGFSMSPVVAELRNLYKEKAGRVYSLDQIKGLQSNIDHYKYLSEKENEEHIPQTREVETDYTKESAKADKGKSKGYWDTEREKFARAFDAFITDTIEEKAARNTYLSGLEAIPPKGEERKIINQAFQGLVQEIKTRETDKGVEMYSVGEQGKYTMPTLKDVQDVFKGQEVKQFPNGAFLIRTKNGAEVIISAVDKITPSKISLNIGYSKTGISENEAIAGKYDKGMIDLVKGQADKWTLAHESVHFMEDIGVINDQEAKLLKRHIQNLTSEGKWQTLNKDDIGGAEDRAEFLAQALQKEPRGLLGRIINKIQDFIDKIVNAFGVRTVRGITRDIKTGEIYGHETGAQREARLDLEGEMYAVKNKTKTPEFKKWFGDSKVVDKNGEPLVVYHGTSFGEFNEFNIPSFFTDDRMAASDYAGDTEGATVFPVYLSIKNPYNIERDEIKDTLSDWLTPSKIKKIKKMGYDGVRKVNLIGGVEYVPFYPTQIKSATANVGTFDESNPDIQYSIRQQTDPPVSSDPKVLNLYLKDETDAIVQTIMNKLHPKNMSWLETMLKSPEWFDHPQIQNIVKLFMRDRNEIYHETFNDLNMTDDIDTAESTVTEAAKALKKSDPKGYERLKEIIDEGDTAWKRSKNLPLEAQLKQFEDHIRKNPATTDDVIRVWKLYRQSYDKALDLMTKQLRDMINQIIEEANLKGETPDLSELQQTLKGALAEMEEWRGFYAPRLREQGNWVVQAYKEHGPLSQNKEWYRVHKGSELFAQREANRLRREGWTIHKIGEVEKIPETIYQDVNSVATAKLIDAALENLGKKNNMANENVIKFNEEILREVSNAIKARGFRSTMIHRGRGNVVRGFVEDPIERHLMYINNVSGGISKARVARMAMKELLGNKVMGKQVGGIDPVKDPKAFATAQDYIKEQLRNSEPADRIIGLAKSIATFKFLGFNLRSLAVNTTAILTTAPAAIHQYVTGGKGSFTEIFRELAKAGKDYGAVMAGKDLGNPDEAAFIADVHKKGWDDAQYTREALGEISKTHSRIWSTMMDASMYLFGKSEKWNRGTTMLAAYRLARKQGMNHDQAAEAAKTSSDKAHGVYGKSTMPMWAQGTNPAAKIGQMMYVYSKFGHNYLQMLWHLFSKVKGENGDIIKERNIKGFMFAFLSPLVLAGGAALPFKDAIFGFASIILGLLGYDDDPEKWVWDEIREHLGMGAEKVGRHGLTGAMGVDISGSLSIGVGIPKNFIDLTGAIGGVGTEIKEAGENLGRGNVGRAAEHLLPTGLSNPLRAVREADEGVSTRNNRRVWDEKGRPFVPGTSATIGRALGFRSTDQAVLSERTWEGHKQQTKFAEKRAGIYERYRAWLLGGRDREEYKKIVKEVQDFNAYIRRNKIRGESFITSESLRNQVRRMQKPSRKERSILEE